MSATKMRPRLSKGILEMKFMKRTKEKMDKEEQETETREMYSGDMTSKMHNNSNFIIEPSFVNCELLMEGRLSFRGMNPEIERLLELEQAEREAAKRQDQPKEVSDQDMAAFYHSQEQVATAASRAMQKKFQKGQPQSNKRAQQMTSNASKKKFKFQKPRDE